MKKEAVILLEFNELTPSLMHRFMAEGKLPNFFRLYNEAHTFITDAGEEPPYLEPWIQWVTGHGGVPYREPQIFNLGGGTKVPPAINLGCPVGCNQTSLG